MEGKGVTTDLHTYSLTRIDPDNTKNTKKQRQRSWLDEEYQSPFNDIWCSNTLTQVQYLNSWSTSSFENEVLILNCRSVTNTNYVFCTYQSLLEKEKLKNQSSLLGKGLIFQFTIPLFKEQVQHLNVQSHVEPGYSANLFFLIEEVKSSWKNHTSSIVQ